MASLSKQIAVENACWCLNVDAWRVLEKLKLCRTVLMIQRGERSQVTVSSLHNNSCDSKLHVFSVHLLYDVTSLWPSRRESGRTAITNKPQALHWGVVGHTWVTDEQWFTCVCVAVIVLFNFNLSSIEAMEVCFSYESCCMNEIFHVI